jgi:hypothetical protein
MGNAITMDRELDEKKRTIPTDTVSVFIVESPDQIFSQFLQTNTQ